MKSYKLFFIVFCLVVTLFLLVGTAAAQNANADTTIEKLLYRHIAAWSPTNVNTIDNVYTKNGIYEDVATRSIVQGREKIKKLIKDTFAAIPDFKVKITRWFSTNNRLACEWIMSGTQTGTSPGGMPASGKSFSVRGTSIAQIENGKFKHWTDYYDRYTFLSQLKGTGEPDQVLDSSTISKDMTDEIEASGVLIPSGPPREKPERISAGKGCIVNLIQPYNISGTLTGTMELNYRILVKGPCGSPAGTFDKEWIAYGIFSGLVNDKKASGNMSYVANVKAGGQVDGQVVFGHGLVGKLHVYGNFSDGKLSYKGYLK